LKDLYEDIRRRRDDIAENSRRCLRYNFELAEFVVIRWREVACGDIILVVHDDAFPADLLLIVASGMEAYISTANLDGETNLKERRPPMLLQNFLMSDEESDKLDKNSVVCEARRLTMESMGETAEAELPMGPRVSSRLTRAFLDLNFECTLAKPEVGLSDFSGSVSLPDYEEKVRQTKRVSGAGNPEAVSFQNFVPRGCVLRNSPWIMGVAAYVGNDTKTRMNVRETEGKFSSMQSYLNRCIQALVTVLLLFCLYTAIGAQANGLDKGFLDFIKRFLIYVVILYQIVPISLYVCFEAVKLLLGFQINADPQMADHINSDGKKAVARTADLVEEVGQVEFIFSDKTGTLTCNEMVFAKCGIEGLDLGDFRPAKGDAKDKTTASSTVPEGVASVQEILRDQGNPWYNEVNRFFLIASSCNTIQVEMSRDDSKPEYMGISPDEVALVQAASECGMTLSNRRRRPGDVGWELELREQSKNKDIVTVLFELPFSFERKRMSVVCEYRGEFMCLTKGADNFMIPLCTGKGLSEGSMRRLKEYAKQGLRTLVLAYKVLERDALVQWHQRFVQAHNHIKDRDALMEGIASEMETALQFCGISAIEDRLQDGAAEAVRTIRAMGIHFWMLTGDKVETAVEISQACGLAESDMLQVQMVDAHSEDNALQIMRTAEKQINSAGRVILIIDGSLVKYAVMNKEGCDLLYRLAITVDACVLCRLAPAQKRFLVHLVRNGPRKYITLAVGDGANDVAMIQCAHVGIGIRGKEGNQATQSCDIAISQFRFLIPLLLCHGRRAYRRVATYLCYYIYKHVALVLGDVMWLHQCDYCGDIAYPEFVSSGYSMMFTSLPVVVILVFDQDVPDEEANRSPELYAVGPSKREFNGWVFSAWMLAGIYHGTVAWLIPSLCLDSLNPDDRTFWIGSLTSFSLVLIFVSGRLWLIALNRCNWRTWSVFGISFLAYAIVLLVLGYTSMGTWLQPQIEGVPEEIFANSKAFTALLLTPLALLADVIVYVSMKTFRPTPLDLARAKRTPVPSFTKVVPQAWQ